MSNNKYLDAIEEAIGVEPVVTIRQELCLENILALALVKELQETNKLLKEVLKPSTQAERGADGT